MNRVQRQLKRAFCVLGFSAVGVGLGTTPTLAQEMVAKYPPGHSTPVRPNLGKHVAGSINCQTDKCGCDHVSSTRRASGQKQGIGVRPAGALSDVPARRTATVPSTYPGFVLVQGSGPFAYVNRKSGSLASSRNPLPNQASTSDGAGASTMDLTGRERPVNGLYMCSNCKGYGKVYTAEDYHNPFLFPKPKILCKYCQGTGGQPNEGGTVDTNFMAIGGSNPEMVGTAAYYNKQTIESKNRIADQNQADLIRLNSRIPAFDRHTENLIRKHGASGCYHSSTPGK